MYFLFERYLNFPDSEAAVHCLEQRPLFDLLRGTEKQEFIKYLDIFFLALRKTSNYIDLS